MANYNAVVSESTTYQVVISNITWNKNTIGNYAMKYNNVNDLPNQFTLDIPMNVIAQAKKKMNDFNDIVESYVYNFLTHKFGHEVYHCQIFLPLD